MKQHRSYAIKQPNLVNFSELLKEMLVHSENSPKSLSIDIYHNCLI